jgi:hypothetical protein
MAGKIPTIHRPGACPPGRWQTVRGTNEMARSGPIHLARHRRLVEILEKTQQNVARAYSVYCIPLNWGWKNLEFKIQRFENPALINFIFD